jgi:biopolymer transport protein ExbD
MELHEARLIIRKAKRRVGDGDDVNALNITSMMDMMTIILVFLLKSFSVSAEGLTPSNQANFTLPFSTSPEPVKVFLAVTVTKEAVVVEGAPIVAVKRGISDGSDLKPGYFIDPSEFQSGNAFVVTKLDTELQAHVKRLKSIAAMNPGDPDIQFTGELLLVCDQDIPFQLVTQVLATAADAGFGKYRLLALKKDSGG